MRVQVLLLLLPGAAGCAVCFPAQGRSRIGTAPASGGRTPICSKLFAKRTSCRLRLPLFFASSPIILFAATPGGRGVCSAAARVGARGHNTAIYSCFVYLLALGRFFLTLGAMDGGSSFGGMGASREALIFTLAEAPLLLALMSVAIAAHGGSIAGIVQWTSGQFLSVFSGSRPGICSLGPGRHRRNGTHPGGQSHDAPGTDHDSRGDGVGVLGTEPGSDRMGERNQAHPSCCAFDRAVFSPGAWLPERLPFLLWQSPPARGC